MNKYYLLAVAFALSGCAINAKLPLNRFESPEANGDWMKTEVLAGYQARTEVQFTSDYTLYAPTVSAPSVEVPAHRLMGMGAVGLARKWDIELSLPQVRLAAKYQILGEPRLESKKGNTSLAVTGGVSTNHEKESASGSIFSSSIPSPNVELSEVLFDFAAVAGHRIDDDVLLYGGPFIDLDLVKINWSPNVATPGTDQKGTIKSYGINLGLQATVKTVFFRGELAGAMTKLGNTNVGRGSYGLAVGAYL
jgi:hypothetical protein